MKSFLLIFAVTFASCATSRAPFLEVKEVKALADKLPDCQAATEKLSAGYEIADMGVTANKMAMYVLFVKNETDGLVLHLANPGYDWTRAEGFSKSTFEGACQTKEGKYFLIYKMTVKLNSAAGV